MRYRLRTLLILLAILPPLLWIGWGKYQAWRAERELQRLIELARLRAVQVPDGGTVLFGGTVPASVKMQNEPPPTPANSPNDSAVQTTRQRGAFTGSEGDGPIIMRALPPIALPEEPRK